jgi:hypothetical protein
MAGSPLQDARHAAMSRLVGQVITEWAHTEWLLMLILGALLRVDLDRARIVLAGYTNFRAKRELILRLGRSYIPDALLAEFETVMGKVKQLSQKRNMLAHHRAVFRGRSTFRFFNDEDPTQPNTFGRYQDVQLGNMKIWVKEICELSGEIHRLTVKLEREQLLEQPRLIPEPTAGPAP